MMLLPSWRSCLLRLVAISCVVAFFSGPDAIARQSAQSAAETLPRVTRAYAIQNARIVQAPGREIPRGNVVIRNGLIEAVGVNVSIPPDARIIDGDTLTVYPGFIDGLSHVGMPEAAPADAEERVAQPGNPPRDRAGIQPERRAADLLQADDEDIRKLRRAGFAVTHVVPQGRSLPGRGAIVSLGDDQTPILEEDASLFMQFEGARGVYPATDMAVLAQIRQLYRETKRRTRLEQMYEQDPSGIERPDIDAAHRALFPVIANEQPVVFFTGGAVGALEIHRALELQEQLGFRMILAGANQAYDVSDALREAGHPVLLTLALPEPPDEERPDTTMAGSDSLKAVTPEAPASHFISDLRTHSFADVGAEQTNLEARQALERERYYETAAILHRNGIRFGFATKDVEPGTIHANLRRMVESGLPETAALAALTTTPASIFGLQRQLGSIDDGKIANLVVTSGSLFDEETAVRFVFVDGIHFEISDDEQSNNRRREN